MGLLTNLIRGPISELAVTPEMMAMLARRRRYYNDDHEIASGGSADLGPTAPTPNVVSAPSAPAAVVRGPYGRGGENGPDRQPGVAGEPGAAAGGAPHTALPAGSGYANIAIQTMRDGGWSDAAIQSALAAGLGEGGFGSEWAKSSVPGEQSFGHWQLNVGGRLPDYQKFAGNATDTATQTRFMMQTMDKLHPGFGKIDDPNLGIQVFHDKFKDYGANVGNLPGAAKLLGQHNSMMQNVGTSTASITSPNTGNVTGASLNKYATGNARLGGASSVEGVHPEFASRINNMVQAMPPEIAAKFNIISGHRSPARQAQVNPSVTNSHHAPGMAVDTTWDPDVRNWITQNGSKFGVGYTIANLPHEGNHLEPTENGQRVPPSQMRQWAQSHMPSSSGTMTASKGSSGGVGSTISNALSSIGNAIIPSAHAETMPQQASNGAPSTAVQQPPASAQPPASQSPTPQPAPSQAALPPSSPPPVAAPPPPQQVASAPLPPDKMPQVESFARPAIYLIRPLNIRSVQRER